MQFSLKGLKGHTHEDNGGFGKTHRESADRSLDVCTLRLVEKIIPEKSSEGWLLPCFMCSTVLLIVPVYRWAVPGM